MPATPAYGLINLIVVIQEGEMMIWRKASSFGFEAETEIGSYIVYDAAALGYGGHAAFFRPPRGRSRLPKDKQALGNCKTMQEAKVRCERHYAENNR
jgi:hypothetical protein